MAKHLNLTQGLGKTQEEADGRVRESYDQYAHKNN